MIRLRFFLLLGITLFASAQTGWKPSNDWGRWRLGQKADFEFLRKNNMTVTFGSGAPNFETVSRKEFDSAMEKAKEQNRIYHEKGYAVLRYLSTSLAGTSDTGDSVPQKNQIRMLQFYNQNWKDYEDYVGPKPPEDPTTWISVRPDGTFPHYRYAPYGQKTGKGFETWGCPNNPYYVRLMEGQIRAQAETGIDGSYVDWTQIAGGTCYCKYCREKFIDWLGKNLPADVAKIRYGVSDYRNVRLPEKRGEPFWMEFVQFRGETVAGFHSRLRAVARTYNPNFMISGNVFGGFGYGPIAYDAAGNMELLGGDGCDDFLYSEIQEFLDSAPRRNEAGTKITNSPALKFLSAVTHGKPVLVYATEITPPVFPNPTEKCLSAMAQINIAEAEANHCIFREKRETPPGATEFYRFLASNETHLEGQQLYSNVAVLASLRQYLADELSFAFSTSRVLADKGIAHTMISDRDLKPSWVPSCDILVVPYLPLLSASQQSALVGFAKRGGTLLVLGKSGFKNEFNLPEKLPVLASALGGTYPASQVTRKLGKGQVVFIPLEIPANRFLIPMKSKGEYTTFGPTMADMFADIPEGYTRNRMDPALRTILEKLAATLVSLPGKSTTRLLSSAPFVELTAMLDKQGNKLLLHAVNYDVTIDGDITPARDLRVQLALPPGKTVRSVRYSGTMGELHPVAVKSSGGNNPVAEFTLDQLNVYGLAVIDMDTLAQ
jgi:hypothetical protein